MSVAITTKKKTVVRAVIFSKVHSDISLQYASDKTQCTRPLQNQEICQLKKYCGL